MPSNPDHRKSNQRQSTTWDQKTQEPFTPSPSSEEHKSVEGLFGGSLGRVLKLITAIVAPTTALVAILTYFGRVYIAAYYNASGISLTMLSLSEQDYLMGSITVIFQTLRGVLLAALFGISAHFLIRRLMKSQWLEKYPRIASSVPWAFVLLGLGLSLSLGSGYVVGSFSIEDLRLIQPLTFTLGFALVGYGLYLSELHAIDTKSSHRQSPQNTDLSMWRRGSLVVVIGLAVYGLFWLSANYTVVLGRLAVSNFAAQIKYLPRVTVYSQESLSLQAPGVTLEKVSEDTKTYRYRYPGLRFLARSGNKYFLLPESWTPTNGATIILPETDTIRIEVAAGEMPR